MNLYQHYEEGCLVESLIAFCWREYHVGTILILTIPVFYHKFRIYMRCRIDYPASMRTEAHYWKWHQRFIFKFNHTTIFDEINNRLRWEGLLPIDWEKLSSGDARTAEEREDSPLPDELIIERLK